MNTKILRKTIIIAVVVGIIALILFLLMKNRKDMQEELSAMRNFSTEVPVGVVPVRLVDFTPELSESGQYFSNSDVQVVSETQGKITKLLFQEGNRVRAGEILATVEREVAESRYELAKENLANAEKDWTRFQTLEGGEAITRQQLEAANLSRQRALTNLTEARQQLENATIKAPVSGIVSERMVEQGTFLTNGMPVCVISDQSRMKFHASLAGTDLQGLSVGQPVRLKADALPGHTFEGKVKHIGVKSNMSGRYLIEMEVLNSGQVLLSGMTGKAMFNLPVEKNKLVIPRKCVCGSLRQAHVFVYDNDKVSRRSITVKLLNDELVAIVSGLKPEEKVVTTGQINLADGSDVKVINNL